MSSTRYQDRQLMDALAREYVVGSMQGAARRRFEGLLAASPLARQKLAAWEQRLLPLARTVTPVEPPSSVWAEISARLSRPRPTSVNSGGIWMGIAAALAFASVSLGLLYLGELSERPTSAYVAVVADDETGPIWVLQAYRDPGELRVNVINERPLPDESDYELWMLPDDGSNPVSLGVLARVGETFLTLASDQLDTLAQTSTLAVSIEPAGGSLIGTPTGPVIYTAPLLTT